MVRTKYKTKTSALKNFNSNLETKVASNENQYSAQLQSKENEIRSLQSNLEKEKSSVTDLDYKLSNANEANKNLESQLSQLSSSLTFSNKSNE